MTSYLTPQFDAIPAELRKLQRWVTWSAIPKRGEKDRKEPFAPDRPNSHASSTDPTTWGTFDQAEAAYLDGGRTGVGIVLNGDGLVGVDLDACVLDSVPSLKAMALLNKLGAAYIEISPSGTGLRALGYGEQLATGVNGSCDGLKAEFYSTGRYLTLTGQTIKTGPLAPLKDFAATAERFRTAPKTKVNAKTGEFEPTKQDERHAALVQSILRGETYHDSLRDLAASMTSAGMNAGAVVNHLRGLMDNSTGPHDERWRARRRQIPDLVSSGAAKFAPIADYVDFIDAETGEIHTKQRLTTVSVGDVLTRPAPPPRFIWEGYLPRSNVTLLGAHGGVGKSTFGLMLCVCAALGNPMFGVPTQQCKTLFVSLEDGAEVVRHRLAQICQTWFLDPADLDGELQIVDGTAYPELFAAETRGAGELTRTYAELHARVKADGFGLVLVDNASDAYGGDEIQRRQVRAFMRALAQIARLTDCAVLLLAHVDKATSRSKKAEGGEGYSGSTAWHNSSRSRWFLTRAEGGTLIFEHQKSNLGKKCDPLELVWPDGGLPMLAGAMPQSGLADRMTGRADDDRAIVLLRLIAEFEGREQFCSPAITSRNHVYAMLKSEPEFQRLKLGTDAVKRIVNQCQRARWIEQLDYRTVDRKPHQRWALTTLGRNFAGLPAPTAPTAPTTKDGASQNMAQVSAPTAPTYLGGVGDRARTLLKDVSAEGDVP
jgi:hypothetical protein